LAICSRLVEMMGGAFSVTSAIGSGSTFEFTIWCRRANTGASQANRRDEVSATGFMGCVLLVEDNPVNRKVARAALKSFGIELLEAEDGRSALDLLAHNTVDLVLMDLHMPVMDGLTATRHIRAAEASGKMAGRRPIVAMTAAVLSDVAKDCRDSGMDDFLPKPFQRQEMATMLARWLKPVAAHAQPFEEAAAPAAVREGALATIDSTQFMRLADTMEEELPALISEFFQSTADILDALADADVRGDMRTLTRHAHSLKSNAATVGASQLAAMARALEAGIKRGQLADLDNKVAAALAEFELVRAELGRLLPAHGAPIHG